jgi:hypothetical protein
MKIFYIEYNGIWFGGRCIVVAENKEDAFQMLFPDEERRKKEEPKVVKTFSGTRKNIVYDWDGDY